MPQHIQLGNCCPEYVTSQFKLHQSPNTGSDEHHSEHSTSHVIWFQDFSTYNKISFSHSCDHLPLNIFIPGTVHHLIYCLTVLVSRSYQWIPIDIFVQQVSRPGLTKGSIPRTLRFMTTAVSQLEKRQVSRCQTRRWHTLTTEEQTVPSKWYLLLARDTCVINRSGLHNLLGSIICKQKLRTSIGKKRNTCSLCILGSVSVRCYMTPKLLY